MWLKLVLILDKTNLNWSWNEYLGLTGLTIKETKMSDNLEREAKKNTSWIKHWITIFFFFFWFLLKILSIVHIVPCQHSGTLQSFLMHSARYPAVLSWHAKMHKNVQILHILQFSCWDSFLAVLSSTNVISKQHYLKVEQLNSIPELFGQKIFHSDFLPVIV